MKIAFVFDDSLDRPDGVQQYLLTIGSWLRNQGHEVHYIVGHTTRQDIPNVHSVSRNIAVRFNGNHLSIPLPARRASLRRLLQQQQFDVLHVQLPHSPWMAGRVIMAAPATTTIVGTFHILPLARLERWGAKLLYLATRRSLRRINAVCSVSPSAQQYAQEAFKLSSTVIPNAVDVSRFSTGVTALSKSSTKTIVFLGRLVERKGCHYLLQAMQQLVVQGQLANTTLIICGDGPLRPELEAYVQQHNLSQQVEFAGFVTEEQKRNYLAAADVAVFPSVGGESFGIVLIEAMAAGAGVVLGGDNPGYRSVLGEQPQLLVDPRDTASFAARLDLLLHDDLLRKTIHEWQMQTITQYDVATVGHQLLNLYSTKSAR